MTEWHALRFAVAAAAYAVLGVLERTLPLRRRTQPGAGRVMVNLAVGAVGLGALALTYGRIVLPAVAAGEAHGWGLLRLLGLPAWIAAPLAFVLLDYTLWVWHLLNHRVGLLWRF